MSPDVPAATAVESDPRRRVLRPYGAYRFNDFPFPHVRSSPCLPAEQYEALLLSLPAPALFTPVKSASNASRSVIDSSRLIEQPEIGSEWKWLAAQHTDPAFWQQVLERFGAQLHAGFHAVEQSLRRPMSRWKVARLGSGESADVHLDCRLVMEIAPSQREAPHVGRSTIIWLGRLDLLDPAQQASGADLQLFRALPGLRYDADRPPRGGVVHEVTVPPQANRFVGFVNGPQAIHALGPRPPGAAPLYHVEFLAQINDAAFTLPQMNPLRRQWHRVLGR